MDELSARQHEVQQLFGRCMLQLQQYELLMKGLLSNREVNGGLSTLADERAKRVAKFAKAPLGDIAAAFFKEFLVQERGPEPVEDETKLVTEATFRTSFRFTMSSEEHLATQSAVKEFVDLRNTLAHHFLQLFDLGTDEGCLHAVAYLGAASKRAVEHCGELNDWANRLREAQRLAAEFMQSDVVKDILFNGIEPDGAVHWPAAGIVSCLRQAAKELAINGWTSLEDAIEYIAMRHPEQLPGRYRCGSWPQVLHESKLFELRYTRSAEASKVAWYRERVKAQP